MTVARPRMLSVRAVPRYIVVAFGAFVVVASVSVYMILTPGGQRTALPTAKVAFGTVRPTISVTGAIGNHVAVDVSSSAGGQIVRWLVQEGSAVQAGQPLAYFEDHANNEQVYLTLKTQMATAQDMEQNANSLETSETKSLGSADQVGKDRSAVQLAFSQWSAATQSALDAANHLAKTSATVIQSTKDALDQANAVVKVDQSELDQAQTKLANDQKPQASQTTIQQDESNVSILQQELTYAQNQYSVDQNAGASSSILQADQNNILQLQEELSAADAALAVAETPAQSTNVVQQDSAAVTTAQDQLDGAKTIANDDNQIYQSALASASAQNGLATARDEENLVAAMQNKLLGDEGSGVSETVVAEDQTALESTIRWVQLEVTLYAEAQQSLPQGSSPVQVTDALANLDQAVGTMNVDLASWQTAKQQLATDAAPAGKRDLLQLEQSVLQDREAVGQAQEALLTAEANVRQSELLAPVTGVVTSLAVPLGARVAPYQAAATILPTGANEQVVAEVDASQVDQVRRGEAVEIVSPDFTGKGSGKVAFVSPLPMSAGQATGQSTSFQYPVYIDVTHLPTGGGSGMVVNCKIVTSVRKHVRVVPVAAVMSKDGKLGVYVKKAGKFTFEKVSLGASGAKYVQIKNLPIGTTVALQRP